MTPNKTSPLSSLTTRQKLTGIVFLLIVILLIWQIVGLFRTDRPTPAPPATRAVAIRGDAIAPRPGMPPVLQPQQMTPIPAQVPGTTPTPDQEAALLKLQQETQTQYLSALNQLQMLKVARDIAETNQAIMAARLATIASEKKMLDLLSPPPPPTSSYTQGLVTPIPSAPSAPPIAAPDASYTVISVSQLQSRWSAVLAYQGNLYSVLTGDILPPDNSRVISISRSGITLEKNGIRKRVSLVPII